MFFVTIQRPPRATRTVTLVPYTTLGRSTMLFPFAAPRVGGELSDAGARAEMEMRVLLWSVERLIGGLSKIGYDSDVDTHLHAVLPGSRSEEHTSELQSLMRISYAVFCLTNKKTKTSNYKLNALIRE